MLGGWPASGMPPRNGSGKPGFEMTMSRCCLSVRPQRLLVEPAVEEQRPHADARPQRRLPSGQRPADRRARRKVRPVRQPRLHVVPQRAADHHAAVHAIAVLHVPAEPVQRVAAVRTDRALRVGGRDAGLIHLQAGERERAVRVADFVDAVAVAGYRRAERHLVRLLHGELELVLELEVARTPAAADLRAADGECVEHADGHRVARRFRLEGLLHSYCRRRLFTYCRRIVARWPMRISPSD